MYASPTAPHPAESSRAESNSSTVQVVLVRHGQSIWNAEGRYQGQQGPGLSELGHGQARHAATYLQDHFDPFHLAVASDLPRVQETLRPWADQVGTEPTIDKRWREIDSGYWAGRLPHEVTELYPEELAAMKRGEDYRRGGGETFAELRNRAWQAMLDWAATQPERPVAGGNLRIVVFTHGGCIQTTAAEALGLPPMGHTWLRPPDNCSITVFEHQLDSAGQLISSELTAYGVSSQPH